MCREECTSSTLSRYMSCNCAPSGASGTPTFRARDWLASGNPEAKSKRESMPVAADDD